MVARSLIDSFLYDFRLIAFKGDALAHLAIKMQACELDLTQPGCDAGLNALNTLECIFRCLPQPLQNHWARFLMVANSSLGFQNCVVLS